MGVSHRKWSAAGQLGAYEPDSVRPDNRSLAVVASAFWHPGQRPDAQRGGRINRRELIHTSSCAVPCRAALSIDSTACPRGGHGIARVHVRSRTGVTR